MDKRSVRTRTTAPPPIKRRPNLWVELPTEEIHLITFEWATRSGKQTVVYVDRRLLD